MNSRPCTAYVRNSSKTFSMIPYLKLYRKHNFSIKLVLQFPLHGKSRCRTHTNWHKEIELHTTIKSFYQSRKKIDTESVCAASNAPTQSNLHRRYLYVFMALYFETMSIVLECNDTLLSAWFFLQLCV